MRLRSFPLVPDNVERCRTVWGDRGFYAEAELDAVLDQVRTFLAEGRARGTLIVDEEDRPRFFGLTVFVHERAAAALKTNPSPRLGHQFLGRNRADVLDEAAIARGNADDGLHLVVVNQGYDMSSADTREWGTLLGGILEEFHDIHRGFRLSSIAGEGFGAESVNIVDTSGAYPDTRRFTLTDLRGERLPSVMFWLTHAQAIARCSPLLPMFTYFPPRVQFTRPEQLVLREAARGATDSEVAARLGITMAAVKSRWKRACSRLADRLPEMLPRREPQITDARGAQVRHLVLEFVRENPAELTPYDAVGSTQRSNVEVRD